jgi:hypothetical protein
MSLNDPRLFIVPVAAADALAWASGQLTDVDLLLRAPLIPEAIFWGNFSNLRGYHDALVQIRAWWTAGARCMILRTQNHVASGHLMKNGCVCTFRETGQGACRFFAGPAALEKWITKFTRPAAWRSFTRAGSPKTLSPPAASQAPGNWRTAFAPSAPIPGPSCPRSVTVPGDSLRTNGA